MRRVTIHDVAARAGVSLATVDRVLNKRPGVRKVTIAKVHAAVDDLGYTPDVFAANLAKRRTYRFQFLLPSGSNAFMEDLRNVTRDLAPALKGERVSIHVELIDSFDSHAVAGTLSILDKSVCDGVAVVAPAFPEVRAAIDRLQDRGVHVTTLVSDHPGSERAHYVGIDNTAAGSVAGRLLGRFMDHKPAKVAFVAGSLGLRDHADRYAGCIDVLNAHFPHLEQIGILEGRDDNFRNREQVAKLLQSHPDISGLYNVGAGNRGVIAALEEADRSDDITFIAHELTPFTRKGLDCGTVDAVIAQDPGHEIRSAIRVLKALCDGVPIIDGQERIGIDIFIKENLPPEEPAGGEDTETGEAP